MPKSLTIATWNLERPKLRGWKKNPIICQQLDEIDADIWILTETNSAINPGTCYSEIATSPISEYHNSGENCSTIWSRYPIGRTFPTFDPSIAVCAEILSPLGLFLVYGTIITWANDKGPTGKSKKWQEHYKSIESHAQDWAKLNQGLPFCVAGDFNQTLSGLTGYGTHLGRKMLSEALQKNNLVCVTDKIQFNIDHICLSKDWAKRVNQVNTWQGFTPEGKPISDHQGVYVDLF
jgi:hypothetical protein